MLAICIECSHKRGMGHLFRSINIIKYLQEKGIMFILLLNEDEGARKVLEQERISDYVVIDIFREESNWETEIINEYNVSCWLNDRLDTPYWTAKHVVDNGIPLYTIDDKGPGANLATGNFASLALSEKESIPGRKIYKGLEYLVLNTEIQSRRRLRKEIKSVVVTLGGSDTYGVTLNVVKFLKKWLQENVLALKITIVLGPNARIYEDVKREIAGTTIELVAHVPSLIDFFYDYDFAITGGGITSIEACASGLPVLVIANEKHEIQVGMYLETLECGWFAGYYAEADYNVLNEVTSDRACIERTSRNCLDRIPLNGLQKIIEIMGFGNERY